MKSQKTNAFQLAIAGGVLVLVLVCATFAWFAVGNLATVKNITAQLFVPGAPAQLDMVEYYDPYEGKWETYDGTEHLPIEPGKTLNFRVTFTAASSATVSMSLSDISSGYIQPGDKAAPSINGVLQYRVGTTPGNQLADNIGFNDLEITDGFANIFNSSVGGESQHTYYYDIKMDGTKAGNDYMNMYISFMFDLTFGQSLD